MGKGSGGNTTTQSSAPPPQVMQAYQQGLGYAQQAASQPYQYYPGNFVAGMSPDQQQAIATVANTQGIVNPYLNAGESSLASGQNAAAGYTNAAGQAMQGGAGTAAGYLNNAGQMVAQTAGAANPFINAGSSAVGAAEQPINAQSIANYESPYQQQVVNATLGEIQQNNAIQQAQLSGNAASQGALGGDRQALAAATLANQQNLATNQTIAGLNNQNYAQALSAAQQDAQRQLQAGFEYGNLGETATNTGLATAQAESGLGNQALGIGSTAAGEYGNLGQYALGIGSTGAQNQLALGQGAQNAALTGAQAQFNMGTAEQQQQQNILNAAYQQWLGGQQYPFQTSQYYANIAEGLGSNMGGTSSTTGPAPNTGSEVAGGLMSAAALAAMFLKRGGRVGRAGGGEIPYGAARGATPYLAAANANGQPVTPQSYVPSVAPLGIGKGPPSPPSESPGQAASQPLDVLGSLKEGNDIGKTMGGIGQKIAGWINNPAPTTFEGEDTAGGIYARGGAVPLGFAAGGVPTSEEAGIIGAEMSGTAQPQNSWAARPTMGDTLGDEQIIYQMMHPQAHARGGAAHFASGGASSGSQLPASVPLVSTAIRTPSGMPSAGVPLGAVPHMAATQTVGAQPQMTMPLGQAPQMGQSFGAGVPQLAGGAPGTRTGAEFAAGPTDFQTYMQQIRGASAAPSNPVGALGPASNASQMQAFLGELGGNGGYAMPEVGLGGNPYIGVVQQMPKPGDPTLAPGSVPAYNADGGDRGVGHARGGRTLADGGIPGGDIDPGVFDIGNGAATLDQASAGTQDPPRLEPTSNPDAPPAVIDNGGASGDNSGAAGSAPAALGTQPLPTPPIPPANPAPAPLGAQPSPTPPIPPADAPPQAPLGTVPPPPSGDTPDSGNFSTIRPVPDVYRDATANAAKKWNVPLPVLEWTIGQESSWNPNALNKQSGAMGLGQFKGATAKQYNIDPYDAGASIDATAHYLHDLYGKAGNWTGAVNDYGTFSTGISPQADAAVKRGFQTAMAHAGVGDGGQGTQYAQSNQEQFDVPPGGAPLGQPGWMPQQYPQIAQAANQALQPLGHVPVPPTTPLEKMAESPWMALAQAGFQMMAGTSPFFGVNVGRGLAAGTQYLQREGQLQRERQTLQYRAGQQNLERVQQQRQQALEGARNLAETQNTGVHYLQALPYAQGAATFAQANPGVPGVPGQAPATTEGRVHAPASFDAQGVTGVPPASPATSSMVPGPFGAQVMPYPQALAEARSALANPVMQQAGQNWLSSYGPASYRQELNSLATDASQGAALKTNVAELETAAQSFLTGPSAESRKKLNDIAATVASALHIPAPDLQNLSSQAQVIPKLSNFIQTLNARVAGDRGGAEIMNLVSQATPTMANTPQGIMLLGRIYNAMADRAISKSRYIAGAVNGGTMTYQDAVNSFNAQYPPEMWASHADPMAWPSNPSQLRPGFFYKTPDGKRAFMWSGSQWVTP